MTQARMSAMQLAARYDLMARTVVVTGAACGIGLELVRALAAADASVIVAVEDPVAARPVIERVQAEFEGASVQLAELSLADLRSVRRFVLSFHGSARPLSQLFNLAVPYPTAQPQLTVDGFERQFGISHLGHFALTTGLLSALRRASDARVVNVTNAAHQLADVDLADESAAGRSYDPWLAYAQSRSAAGLFTSGLHQHFAAEGISCNVVNLGGAPPAEYAASAPDLVRAQGWASFNGVVGPPKRTAAEVAGDVLWAGLAAELDAVSGQVVQDMRVLEPWTSSAGPDQRPGYLPRLTDPGAALDLWDTTERLTQLAS